MLPANHDESQLGRFTQTIAKALASRLTLYYASQYWNPENDITKWQTAASTAKAAIDYAEQNGYRLADNYADIFLQRLIRKSFGAKTLVEVNVFGGIGMVFL